MFKVGDIIVGTEKSNYKYTVTCKDNGFVGKVIKVDLLDIKVEVIKSNYSGDIGQTFWVNSIYFKYQYPILLINFLKSLE